MNILILDHIEVVNLIDCTYSIYCEITTSFVVTFTHR